MNYPFVVIPQEDGAGWSIQFPDLPGATGFVTDLAQIGEEVKTIQFLWLDGIEDDGLEVPEPSYDWDPVNRQPEDFTVGKVYTTQEAAEMLGLTVRRVNSLSNSRGIGRLIGKAKVFTSREIENMKHRKVGRPKLS